jgi:hypothetical protein
MTTVDSGAVAKPQPSGLLRLLVGSMWGFWFLLLAFSLGLATVIYYVWLRGSV